MMLGPITVAKFSAEPVVLGGQGRGPARPCHGEGDTRTLWPSRRWQGQNVPGLAQPCEGRG